MPGREGRDGGSSSGRAQPILLANENAILLDAVKRPAKSRQPPNHNEISKKMKKLLSGFLLVGLLAAGASFALAADTAPKSVIHVITVAFKDGTTPEQIQAALDGAQKLPAQYAGITRVWTKAIKVQNLDEAKVKKTHVIVMEFASEQALKDYTDSAAQKEWYKLYLPIRLQSTTYDITN
jgi:hypothetical protein